MELNKVNNLMGFVDQIDKKSINTKSKESFGDLLNNALNHVNQMQIDSTEYKKMLAIGEVDNLHDVSIVAEKANISMQITLSLRNKIVEAYKEIMRIQI